MIRYLILGFILWISFYLGFVTTYPAVNETYQLAASIGYTNATSQMRHLQVLEQLWWIYNQAPYFMAGFVGLLVLIATQLTEHEASYY